MHGVRQQVQQGDDEAAATTAVLPEVQPGPPDERQGRQGPRAGPRRACRTGRRRVTCGGDCLGSLLFLLGSVMKFDACMFTVCGEIFIVADSVVEDGQLCSLRFEISFSTQMGTLFNDFVLSLIN